MQAAAYMRTAAVRRALSSKLALSHRNTQAIATQRALSAQAAMTVQQPAANQQHQWGQPSAITVLHHKAQPAGAAVVQTGSKPTFYKRVLPATCKALSVGEGRELFKQALSAGTMENYLHLADQFLTQDEPAYCGVSTLTMVLNALAIDPGRVWKGSWRFFNEKMLGQLLV